MDLEEIIQQLKDAQTVSAAQTLRHETRLKEHQQWLEDNELAYARHRIAMAEFDAGMKRLEAAQAVNEEKLEEYMTRLSAAQLVTEEKLQGLIDALRSGSNGHSQQP